jgi:hypothetical protein
MGLKSSGGDRDHFIGWGHSCGELYPPQLWGVCTTVGTHKKDGLFCINFLACIAVRFQKFFGL